jgi:hypothetical protein
LFSVATISDKDQSKGLELGLREISVLEMGLIADDSTLACGIVDSNDRVLVQVCPRGLRVVRLPPSIASIKTKPEDMENEEVEVEALQDMVLADSEEVGGLGGNPNERIVQAQITSQYTLVLTSIGTMYLLNYTASDEGLVILQKHEKINENTMTVVDGSPTLGDYLSDELVTLKLFTGPKFHITSSINQSPWKSLHPVTESLHRENSIQDATVPSNTESNTHKKEPTVEDQTIQAQIAEEIFLYGSPLSESESGWTSGESESGIQDSSNSFDFCLMNSKFRTPAKANLESAPVIEKESMVLESDGNDSEQSYLLFGERDGTLLLVHIDDPSQVWKLSISAAEDIVKFHKCNEHDRLTRTGMNTSDSPVNSRILCDIRMDMIYSSAVSSIKPALTITAMFESGEFLVYYYINPVSSLRCTGEFVKVNHTIVNHRQKHRGVRLNSETWLSSDFGTRIDSLATYRMNLVPTVASSDGVLIPGPRPAVVFNYRGRPQIVNLTLPELPYANPGSYILAGLSVGKVSAIITLWMESSGEQLSNRRILSLYSTPTPSIVFPDSIATLSKLEVGSTIHNYAELQPRTDDKIELSLLLKKTYILACSSTIKKPFTPGVLTEEEQKVEEELYDRFFYDLTSFKQPDETLAPAPLLESEQHRLVLAQGGCAIDEYLLRDCEQVLGIEVLYITTEKWVEPKLTIAQMLAVPFVKPPPVQTTVRRVFIAVSTLIADKHGEDTQGEGRVMLLSLGYKNFEGDREKSSTDNSSAENKEGEPLIPGSGPVPLMSLPFLAQAFPGVFSAEESAAQSQFLESIQPKLQLHWQGPGPASVVRQLGEYLLTTVGFCAYVYKMNKETLEVDQVAFYFAQVTYFNDLYSESNIF